MQMFRKEMGGGEVFYSSQDNIYFYKFTPLKIKLFMIVQ